MQTAKHMEHNEPLWFCHLSPQPARKGDGLIPQLLSPYETSICKNNAISVKCKTPSKTQVDKH